LPNIYKLLLSRILLRVIESGFSAVLDSICGLARIMQQASGVYPTYSER